MRFMKKSIILRQMDDPKNNVKWTKYRIKNRFLKKKIPQFGNCV